MLRKYFEIKKEEVNLNWWHEKPATSSHTTIVFVRLPANWCNSVCGVAYGVFYCLCVPVYGGVCVVLNGKMMSPNTPHRTESNAKRTINYVVFSLSFWQLFNNNNFTVKCIYLYSSSYHRIIIHNRISFFFVCLFVLMGFSFVLFNEWNGRSKAPYQTTNTHTQHICAQNINKQQFFFETKIFDNPFVRWICCNIHFHLNIESQRGDVYKLQTCHCLCPWWTHSLAMSLAAHCVFCTSFLCSEIFFSHRMRQGSTTNDEKIFSGNQCESLFYVRTN